MDSVSEMMKKGFEDPEAFTGEAPKPEEKKAE